MSKSTFATTEGAASAVLHLLADKEATLRAELAKIEQVRAILADKAIQGIPAPDPSPALILKRRGRPKKAKP